MSKVAVFRSARCLSTAVLVTAVLASCTATEPFVHDPTRFNRNSADFGKPPQDLAAVDVCYSRYATTADAVSSLAAEQCARYGKRAVPYGQDLLQCPILTPVRARYHCVAP